MSSINYEELDLPIVSYCLRASYPKRSRARYKSNLSRPLLEPLVKAKVDVFVPTITSAQ